MAFYIDGTLPDDQTLSLSLDRWQELMTNICECSFNGVRREDTGECCYCKEIWTQSDRNALATVIGQAEEMREAELGYHLSPKYLVDELNPFVRPLILKRKFLVSIGVRATTDIALSTPITLSVGGVINDPVTLVIPTTVTVPGEIKVYYAGTTTAITPSSVKIAGGNATIKIPRCRLLKMENVTDCEPFPNYIDDANFVTTVDVKRVYTNTTVGNDLVWDNDCCPVCDDTIAETTQSLYSKIDNSRLSIVQWKLGHYASGAWHSDCCFTKSCAPGHIRTSYLSGRQSSISTEMRTAALAHTLLPALVPNRLELCSGCWKFDMENTKTLTPYGNKNGAVAAWLADSRAKIGYGGKSPKGRQY